MLGCRFHACEQPAQHNRSHPAFLLKVLNLSTQSGDLAVQSVGSDDCNFPIPVGCHSCLALRQYHESG